MKRIYLLFLMFIAQCSMFNELLAQDAFYIYRNDGDFDGFFYDEVIRMGYSKFDLDSVEYDAYVVQEIETADSLYRIPLCAIDSIGFQQPEIKLNPKVKLVRDGLLPYIVSASNTKVILSEDVPDALVPYPNTILVGLATDENAEQKYYNGSFACIVKQVYKQGNTNGRTIYGEEIDDLAQIFDQYIGVEQLGVDEQGNVRRRVAGFNEDGTPLRGPRRSTSNYKFSLIDWNGHITLNGDSDQDGPMNISYNLGVDVGLKVSMRVVFSISGIVRKHIYVKAITTEEMSAALAGEIKTQVTFSKETDCLPALPGFMFPTFIPLFEVRPLPKAFIELGGSCSLKMTLPKLNLSIAQTLIIDNDDPWLVSLQMGDRDKEPEGDGGATTSNSLIGGECKFNGYLYGGLMIPITVQTNHWLEKIFHASIGSTFKFGPKLEGTLFITTEGMAEDNCFAGSGIDFSLVDLTESTGVTGSVGGKTAITRSIWDSETKFFTTHYEPVPRIQDIELKDKWTAIETAKDSETGQTYVVWSGISSVQPELYLKGTVISDVQLGVQLMKSSRPLNNDEAHGYAGAGTWEWLPASEIIWIGSYYTTNMKEAKFQVPSPITISDWGTTPGIPDVCTRYSIIVYSRNKYEGTSSGYTPYRISELPIHQVIMSGEYPYN